MASMNKKALTCVFALFMGVSSQNSMAIDIITFDEAINGLESFSFDANNDGLSDVIFSTVDPFGFNTVGPGPNMSYIEEPGLEGTTLLGEDLRVDFLGGAVGNLEFGFALNTFEENHGVTFSVFDKNDNLLNTGFKQAFFTTTPEGVSSFPEAVMSLNFPGVAAYGIFDFDGSLEETEMSPNRYIIDNFTGTFNAADVNIAAPGSLPETALLPDNTDEPFFDFAFNVGENGLGIEFPIFIDPDVSIGYTYEVDPGSPLVTSITVPAPLANGDSEFVLSFGGNDYTILAGEIFDVLSVNGGAGIDFFTISGIDTEEMLDPTDPQAFVTGLIFDSIGNVGITQTPITTFVSSVNVPEPGSFALLGLGLLGLTFTRKKHS